MDIFRLYFNLIPSELNEVIISYLDDPDDVRNIGYLIIIPINWGTISYYHLGKYRFGSDKISMNLYIEYLFLLKLAKILNSKYSLDELS
jgi:hypothetical protein